jgi:hypothetical protein
MPRNSALLILAFCALFTVLAGANEIVPAGTLLRCTVDEPNFSSKTAAVGDPVLCHLGSLSSFGHSVFPRGAMLSGHLQDYKNPGHFVGKGWIQIEFDRVILPGAEVLPLQAKIIAAPHLKVDKKGNIHGQGHPTRDAIEWMIPVLWPIKIITLPARGPYPALKGESPITLRLEEDIEVPLPMRSSVPMPPWATPSGYRVYGYNGGFSNAPAAGASPSLAIEPTTYARQIESAPQLTPSAPSRLTVIALKGGGAFLAQQYWIESGKMHCVSAAGEEKSLALEDVDLTQTVHLNQERNVDFVLQSRPTEQ